MHTLPNFHLDKVSKIPRTEDIGKEFFPLLFLKELSIRTIESRRAVAGEGGEGVPARPAVEAGLVQALINVGLAGGARESGGASAAVAVDEVGAVAVVAAGVWVALVNVRLAVGPLVAWRKQKHSKNMCIQQN